MRRFTLQMFVTMMVALTGAVAAISAEVPPTVSRPASGAPLLPDWTKPEPRLPQGPKPVNDPGPENAVTPQIEVPLKRGERKPERIKPGAPNKVGGGVDDSAARCLATSNARRADCAAPASVSASQAKAR